MSQFPIDRTPYVPSAPDQLEIDKQVEALAKGFVRPSSSPCAGNVVLAERSGEDCTRICIHYRKLNSITVPDHQPIPRINHMLDCFGSSKYFSALDITSGYWHIHMKSEDIPKTYFITHSGHYEWLVMPFPLRNAPTTFQRAIKSVLKKYCLKNVVNYFDDIVVHSETFDELLQHHGALLKVLVATNIKLNFRKCRFDRTPIDYLGQTISCGILSPQKKEHQSYSWC